jgi:hypothetical protein
MMLLCDLEHYLIGEVFTNACDAADSESDCHCEKARIFTSGYL